MSRFRPLLILGTRPEAIKMAPIVESCRARTGAIDPVVCFTGQHNEMLWQVADYFGIRPDFDLQVMSPGQSLAQLTARLLTGLDETLVAARPDCVVAQGDTTTVLAAALAAFYRKLPFVHVEAGLRTADVTSPWPEELNRRMATIATTLHCAPTARAAENLCRAGVAQEQICITGNTVIDALLATVDRERQRNAHWQAKYDWLADRDLVLITVHRRENHGGALDEICGAIAALAARFADHAFLLPVHLNPNVQSVVRRRLAGIENLRLTPPLAYPEFVWVMDRAKLIVSDSGGVQEEAPSLRRPVVALRETTERSEAVDAGAVVCVGCCPERIVSTVSRLLTDTRAYAAMQTDESPFGDGRAAERIVERMLHLAPPPTFHLSTITSSETISPPVPASAAPDAPVLLAAGPQDDEDPLTLAMDSVT
jgi:UDP-N-acetylglucosamine 2-epimerase (non-hydrolysing)